MKTFITLYKSKTPQKSVLEGEYYQPFLEAINIAGKTRYFVREKHAWFDDEKKKPINLTTTLSPEEGLEDRDEARRLYDQQIEHRVGEGFAHAFYVDPFAEEHFSYLYLG